MGLKKYEIITVGSDRRVRALRSWAVGDRYVNIGDVGGIVYDEKTLSQDGACWLFRGNFGFPGARIGGDSIVDVGETTLSATGAPNVDILGSSVVVGSKLLFESRQTDADAVVLTAADFEQGGLNFLMGQPLIKFASSNSISTKAPIFMGGKPMTIKADVPGFTVTAQVYDRDGLGIGTTAAVNTAEGVTITVPAGQYFYLNISKNPISAIVPADATTAAITFTGTYETKLSVIDSRVEINPATSAGVLTLRPGGTYTRTPGAKYPDSVIQNSKVSMMAHATANRTITLMAEFINTNAVIDVSGLSGLAPIGIYKNVKNLTISGNVSGSAAIKVREAIQATDCDNFAVSPTIFPGLAAAQAANMPFIFQGCNVPNGIFYHHARIANTYKNIDFALAQADLGKTITSSEALVSSEVEGMYRLYSVSGIGALVESYDSVRYVTLSNIVNSYGTTIHKDAYLSGKFDIAGTNVFGNKACSHPLAQVLKVAPRAVQGMFNATTIGETITGVVADANRVCVPLPFRINGSEGFRIICPAGIECVRYFTDVNGEVMSTGGGYATGVIKPLPAQLKNFYVYLLFRKTGNGPITPEDLAGVTITVYNGCKIVNTGETAVSMKGNFRVEDNVTLTNCSLIGSGYFGGNAVMSGVLISGCVYMKDNATFVKTGGAGVIRNLKMTDNATAVVGDVPVLGSIALYDNSVFKPSSFGNAEADISMHDNATVTSSLSLGGKLTMRDDATVSAGQLLAVGDITLCGSYKQTATKSWTGKRVIFTETDPTYDNNVKTQYDF